jgi:hypothetical protein
MAGPYHNVITGVDNAEYDDDHKYPLKLQSSSFSITFRSGTSPIFYSFNGSDDHGVVSDLPGYLQVKILEPWVTNQFWLKGGTGDEIVEVEARAQ